MQYTCNIGALTFVKLKAILEKIGRKLFMRLAHN